VSELECDSVGDDRDGDVLGFSSARLDGLRAAGRENLVRRRLVLLSEENYGCPRGERVLRDGERSIGGLNGGNDVEAGRKKTSRSENDGLEGTGGESEGDEKGVCVLRYELCRGRGTEGERTNRWGRKRRQGLFPQDRQTCSTTPPSARQPIR
jgi:hypothetical protein